MPSLAALLAAASLAAQALADVEIDDRRIPLSLRLLSVAESGERKSAVDGETMRASREYERDLGQSNEAELLAHAAATEEWNARREAAKADAKKAKGKGLALFKLLAVGYPSIGAFSDEAAQVFGGHGMTKETVMRTAGALWQVVGPGRTGPRARGRRGCMADVSLCISWRSR